MLICILAFSPPQSVRGLGWAQGAARWGSVGFGSKNTQEIGEARSWCFAWSVAVMIAWRSRYVHVHPHHVSNTCDDVLVTEL